MSVALVEALLPERLEVVREALKDQYFVREQLGRGSMAGVFLAERLPDRRVVALKVLHPEFAVSVGGARFHREIEFLKHLDHPQILPLLASGESNGRLYYVMPYADGGSLSTLLRERGHITLDETIEVARNVAAALDYAHEQSIVHRDIKPGNILFNQGQAVLCDFGVAKALIDSGGDRISSSGLIIGTPTYMSPEQASGTSKVDARSDVYSLGCVVYEMLVGEPPFTGRSAQSIMARHVAERPPSARVVRPGLPEHVEVAIHKALAKKPKQRPESAGEFVQLLAM